MRKAKGPANLQSSAAPLSDTLSHSPSSSVLNEHMNHTSRQQEQVLTCPICGATTYNLVSLNKHIDLNHAESPVHDSDDPAEALLAWFRRTQIKVSDGLSNTSWQKLGLNRIAAGIKGSAQAPLDLIKGMDTFELNSNVTYGHVFESSVSSASGSRHVGKSYDRDMYGMTVYDGTPSSSSLASGDQSAVTRIHWQLSTVDDRCSYSRCSSTLGILSGKENCRKCGRLYCDLHSRFQMKLASNASHDPVSGYWSRVCQLCYMSREGYMDVYGVSRNRTQGFLKVRGMRIDRALLEANKIEKRLEKITRALTGSSIPSPHQRSWSNLSLPFKNSIDQAVVAWVPDDSSSQCYICGSQFGLVNRRHHCRLCGRLVCGSCSTMIDIKVPTDGVYAALEKIGQIRSCSQCKELIGMRDNSQDESTTPQLVSLYQQIVRLRSLVQETLPKFNSLLVDLRSRASVSVEEQDYQIALRYRKQLLDYFTELERHAKQIKRLPTSSTMTLRLHENVHQSAIQFLQANMLTLQLMPDTIGFKARQLGNASDGIRPDRKKILSTEHDAMYKELDMTSQALDEQIAQLEGMLLDATSRRRLEDAVVLNTSLSELRQELQCVQQKMDALYE
ncbi:hypothetical protein BATDEDRAFT_25704 [Batrachochytrium dendrobatidis JAM81]|uniref:FYVE-type domain-containing protein n=1 Tax=Batrachochytrium dendrobatidis (strain JAM81 / FGSC 10211) TaxID=684364 RepID=F4P5C7_BATDJ|nr:uncharacterized protein BATDEDRAFT_25704 [Batrachochytrium dendrobatidis JAM81]EGF79391.1 hypothetical protein BATDEDRAFT_25704 [Batrachochytrium dendrobatidis JAM81]KAJ8323447.1 carboxypeptidase Y-deficient [Batrachochytrium dendrobatidis]KAK5668124.1 carboxypeptidase Y-deficient [Batrachochytrium dendrobatidis]|eukprot:XP_006679855.1 hypothetical protein BATDEDRAFT_25704 [Batrachochytrium dendrobatidis JAM81]